MACEKKGSSRSSCRVDSGRPNDPQDIGGDQNLDDWRALFEQIQRFPQSQAITDADIAREIDDDRRERRHESIAEYLR